METIQYTLYSVPLPGPGMILALIMNIINGFDASYSVDYFHKIIESFKFAYAKRTLHGDIPFNQSFVDQFADIKYADSLRKKISVKQTFNGPNYYGAEYIEPSEHGTVNISVLTANGDAVSVIGTINHL